MATLEDAVKKNNYELVEAILGGWGPKDDGYSNNSGQTNSVHALDDFGDPLLIWATQQGDETMCSLLVDAGASVFQPCDSDGDTPIHRAVKFHHYHMVEFFMQRLRPKERQALNQLRNHRNMTALHYAGKYGYDEIAELLINSGGADSTGALDDAGKSALDHAAENKHALCVAVLEDPDQARADAKARSEAAQAKADNDLLLEAAGLGDVAWVEQLLSRGADVLYRDLKTGDQALHISARQSHDALSKFLVSRGADPISANKVIAANASIDLRAAA